MERIATRCWNDGPMSLISYDKGRAPQKIATIYEWGSRENPMIGYGVAPTHRNRGLMTRLLKEFCRRKGAACRMWIDRGNAASIRVAEKAGFVLTEPAHPDIYHLWYRWEPTQ